MELLITLPVANTDTEAIRDGLFTAVGTPTNCVVTKIGNSSFSVVKSTGTLAISASVMVMEMMLHKS